jgi:hypothetical protein
MGTHIAVPFPLPPLPKGFLPLPALSLPYPYPRSQPRQEGIFKVKEVPNKPVKRGDARLRVVVRVKLHGLVGEGYAQHSVRGRHDHGVESLWLEDGQRHGSSVVEHKERGTKKGNVPALATDTHEHTLALGELLNPPRHPPPIQTRTTAQLLAHQVHTLDIAHCP